MAKLITCTRERLTRPWVGESIGQNYKFAYRSLTDENADNLVKQLRDSGRIVANWRNNDIIAEYVIKPVSPEPIRILRDLWCSEKREFMLAISDIIPVDEYFEKDSS